MVYGTQITTVTRAFVNQQASLGGLTLYLDYLFGGLEQFFYVSISGEWNFIIPTTFRSP